VVRPASIVAGVSGVGFCAKRAVNGTAGVGMFGATVNASAYDTTTSTPSAPALTTNRRDSPPR
jgi:hypothetical protein